MDSIMALFIDLLKGVVRWFIPALLKLIILQKSGTKSQIAILKIDDVAAAADRVGSHNISRNLNLLH
jgi:hypothetical protein